MGSCSRRICVRIWGRGRSWFELEIARDARLLMPRDVVRLVRGSRHQILAWRG
jgi:hypothetical protein